MKFNKWTLGLAAVGVVSLTSAARADEKMSTLQTALSNTTFSGYVDVAAQYGNATGVNYSQDPGNTKLDGISLNVVDLTLDKPEDEGPWASGYHVDLWFGGDAASLDTESSTAQHVSGENEPSDFAIRQAYLTLRTPGGNGIDWKIGVWDTIIGYESTTSASNPNYTHSYGYDIEPTTHTGIYGTYKVNDEISVQAGIADDSFLGPSGIGTSGYVATINGASGNFGMLNPTLLAALSLTAPNSWGWMKGATGTIGAINTGHTGNAGGTSLYAGATVPTPMSALKFGVAYDYLDEQVFHQWVVGLYSTYQATDKLSLNLRGERGEAANGGGSLPFEELTATLQYNLWANVLSRVEIRWDHSEHGDPYNNVANGAPLSQAVFFAAQFIYQF